jgi:hypothetical protein
MRYIQTIVSGSLLLELLSSDPESAFESRMSCNVLFGDCFNTLSWDVRSLMSDDVQQICHCTSS